MKSDCEPFLRWAGGKRWLSPAIKTFAEMFTWEGYIEPFVGAGSVFFSIKPNCAIISDINPDLINIYKVVQKHPDLLEDNLKKLKVSKEDYYKIRSHIPSDKIAHAARLIYLNRTCFNGLYRTDRNGNFNVPYGGGRDFQKIIDRSLLSKAASILKNTEIYSQCFRKTFPLAKTNNLIYCDPAYTVAHDNNGFLRYNDKIFSWKDQESLRDLCFKAVAEGVTVLVSNAAHQSVKSLYYPYKPILLRRYSGVGAKVGRKLYSEYFYVLSPNKRARNMMKKILFQAGYSIQSQFKYK